MDKAYAQASEADHYDKWRAKDDLRTVVEAERIKKDPVRMKHVKRCAKEEIAEINAMKAIADGE